MKFIFYHLCIWTIVAQLCIYDVWEPIQCWTYKYSAHSLPRLMSLLSWLVMIGCGQRGVCDLNDVAHRSGWRGGVQTPEKMVLEWASCRNLDSPSRRWIRVILLAIKTQWVNSTRSIDTKTCLRVCLRSFLDNREGGSEVGIHTEFYASGPWCVFGQGFITVDAETSARISLIYTVAWQLPSWRLAAKATG